MCRRLWLIGMMGSGKSTVGAAAARQLAVDHHDTDEIIAARAGMPVHEIFQTIGVVAFRDLEHQAIAHAATLEGVISTGGGAVMDADSRATMANTGIVVYLACEPTILHRRVGAVESRPLLHAGDPLETLQRLLEEREPWYRATAHHVIDTTDKRRSDVVGEVIETWNAS